MPNWFFVRLFVFQRKLTAIDLSKWQPLDADPRAIPQISILETWIVQEIQQCFSLLKKQIKTVLDFSQETAKVL